MGFVQPIQSLSQSAWAGANSGQDRGASKAVAGRPRIFSPTGVETLEEALTYIEQLSQDGRTDELVSLLRGNQVFREAWQTLQQYASNNSKAAAGLASSLQDAASPSAQSGLPVSLAGVGSKGRLPIPGYNLSGAQVTANLGLSPEIHGAQANLVPAPKASRTLAAGRQVYERQARYYNQEKANFPRISIRV
jgi:hypothetical protein